LFAREAGTLGDPAAFEAAVTQAVSDAVSRQAKLGLDVISDGEMSKISYATYIKERFTGFDGDIVWLEIDDNIQIRIARAAVQRKVDTASGQTGGLPTDDGSGKGKQIEPGQHATDIDDIATP
jgi:hypothetical protein